MDVNAGNSQAATPGELPPARHSSTESLRQKLSHLLNARDVAAGTRLLNEAEPTLLALKPADEHAAEILLLVAQWVDAGFRDLPFLDTLLAKFPADARHQLRVGAYLRLRMVEAFRALSVDAAETTIRILGNILVLDDELLDPELKVLAHLWTARAHRKQGEYGKALEHITTARELAQSLPESGAFSAIIKIQEAWLLFQHGNSAQALQLLNAAEEILKDSGHSVALGNIESARGRIVRRRGDYWTALDHFTKAVAIYESTHPNHPNLARVLTNSAFVKRLLALQLKRKVDASVSRRDVTGVLKPQGEGDAADLRHLRRSHQELYRSAIAELERAKRICLLHGHDTGLGSALLSAGRLHLDSGDVDLAAREAADAYALGTRTNSPVLRARALIVEALTENVCVNEMLGDGEHTPRHAMKAKQHCLEAIEIARQTQNKRLLLSAYIALGETACNEFFHDWSLGKQCADSASELLDEQDADHLVQELHTLKQKLLRHVGIDDVLRAWSEGIVVDKTFKEVTEEFAELIIPRIWAREGRKVSRVAKKLSMSPQKVRRFLKRAGVAAMEEAEDGGRGPEDEL